MLKLLHYIEFEEQMKPIPKLSVLVGHNNNNNSKLIIFPFA